MYCISRLSYRAVDVNVHPNKLEVRFINEKPIFDAVYHGVQTALNQGDNPIVMDVKKVVSHHPFMCHRKNRANAAKNNVF